MSEEFFKSGVEMLVYGPVPGKPFYITSMLPAFIEQCRLSGKDRWPRAMLLFRDSDFVWLQQMDETREAGRFIFVRQILSEGWREKFNKEWQKGINNIDEKMREIDKTDLNKLTDAEFTKLFKDFIKLAENYERPTVIPELANYGADKYLEELIKGFVPTDEINDVMHVLTAPEILSFNQLEEIELQKASNIEAHWKKYAWLQNGFGNLKPLTVDFFMRRQAELEGDIEEEHRKRLAKQKKEKERIRDKYKLTVEIMDVAHEIWQTIAMQDERKKYNFIGTGYLNILLREVARRYGYEVSDLEMAWPDEIEEIMEGNDLKDKLKKRLEGYAIAFNEKSCWGLGAKETSRYWLKYVENSVEGDVNGFEGVVACRGTGGVVKGVARIVKDPSKTDDFEEGQILVAAMTSPDYVFAMRKAGAIVTNFGGLTSHAAIVSRELNKPCIIGTRIATQMLKDGDEIEVDADNGVVRILK